VAGSAPGGVGEHHGGRAKLVDASSGSENG
jgi:hypothetical protein